MTSGPSSASHSPSRSSSSQPSRSSSQSSMSRSSTSTSSDPSRTSGDSDSSTGSAAGPLPAISAGGGRTVRSAYQSTEAPAVVVVHRGAFGARVAGSQVSPRSSVRKRRNLGRRPDPDANRSSTITTTANAAQAARDARTRLRSDMDGREGDATAGRTTCARRSGACQGNARPPRGQGHPRVVVGAHRRQRRAPCTPRVVSRGRVGAGRPRPGRHRPGGRCPRRARWCPCLLAPANRRAYTPSTMQACFHQLKTS